MMPRPVPVSPGTAIMESPQPRSARFNVMGRVSETESNLSSLSHIGLIHSVQIGKDYYAPQFLDAYMAVGDHHHILPFKSPTDSPTPTTQIQQQKYRVLGTLSLIGVSYMATAGGPVGSEPLISTAGPLIGLLSIAAYFLLCQIPIALMVTELCCVFPENGGFIMWTKAAFGPYWGFQVGYWAWLMATVNNAFYPGLIYNTVSIALGVQASSAWVAYLIKLAIALVLALPSYLGVRFIGVASLIMMSLVLLLTVIFTVWGVAAGDGAFFRLRETRTMSGDDTVDWTRLIGFLFTNFDRLPWISMIGGEVRNPARTFPRVIFFTVLLALATFVAPFLTTVIGDKIAWRELVPNSYPVIARALGGPVLQGFVVVLSVVSYMGLFANSVFLESFLLQGMAQSKLLPAILSKRSKRFKTPQYALLASLLTMVVILGLELDTLLDMTNTFSSAMQVVIVLSMLQLRRSFPDWHSPMRVPGNLVTMGLMLLPAFGVFLLIIGSTLVNWEVGRYIIAFAVPGLLIPIIRKWLAGRRYFG